MNVTGSSRKLGIEHKSILNEVFQDFQSIRKGILYSIKNVVKLNTMDTYFGELIEPIIEKPITKKGCLVFENGLFRHISKSQMWSNYIGYIGSVIYLIIYFTVSALITTEVLNIPTGTFVANLIFAASVVPGFYYAWKANGRRTDFQAVNNQICEGMLIDDLIKTFEEMPKSFDKFYGTVEQIKKLEEMGSRELKRHQGGTTPWPLTKLKRCWNVTKGFTPLLQRSSPELMREFTTFYFELLSIYKNENMV